MDVVSTAILIAAVLVAYLLPTYVAAWRKHHQAKAILALNIMFGWTIIGWEAALIWALTAIKPISSPS